MYSVYIHKCPNGKVYVGITSRKPIYRWNNGKGYASNKHFYNAILKYGWENIELIVVAENITKEEACKREKELILLYDSTNREKGYNNSIGGELSALGFRQSEEAKIKISKASKGRKSTPCQIEKRMQSKRKAVNVYNIDGELICKCKSLTEAEKVTGVDNANISATCRGKYQQIKGYIFKYADDNTEVVKARKKYTPVNMYSLDGTFIKRFESIKLASAEMNVSDTHISDCCKGKNRTCGGYKWKYA